MQKFVIKKIKNICLSIVVISISACATSNDITEYNTPNARKNNNLMVPPGLSSPELGSTYKMELANQGVVNSGYKLDQIKDMRIAQGGSERWLIVNNKTVNQVWPMMIAYLTQQGLVIKYQNQAVGVIQTDWATKNNTVHESGVRSFFEWIGWGNMYSMQSQYMFRINLWQNDNNTLIFVTDYQMSEVYQGCVPSTNSSVEISDKQITHWMPLPPNPQLELDFLLHFMMFAGLSETQVKAEVAAVKSVAVAAHLVGEKIIIDDDFDRAWWRTALALERVNLGVVDKNRSLGEYYVYSLQSQVENPEQGMFSRWFGSKLDKNLEVPVAQYTIKLVVIDSEHTELTINPTAQNVDKQVNNKIKKYLAGLVKQLQ